MKVIKPGDGRRGWAKQYTCTGRGNGGGGCGAVLLVEIGDLFHTSRSCYDETDYFPTFACVECGVKTDIPEVDLPAGTVVRLLPSNP